jgi:hypothetical protein
MNFQGSRSAQNNDGRYQRRQKDGTKLDKLARQIADQCPESSTKKDLLAYLQRIALYCHQLNITSKVKADVQNISGELIVSGVSARVEGQIGVSPGCFFQSQDSNPKPLAHLMNWVGT